MLPISMLLTFIQGGDGAAEDGAGTSGETDTDWLDPQTYLDLAETLVIEMGPRILAALAVFIIGKWVAKRLSNLVKKLLTKSQMAPMLVGFVGNIVNMALLVFVVIAAISQLGVDTTSFAAIIAAAGLAIRFALQGSLSNFASGVMIMIFRPFKIGDFVEAGGTSGVIQEILIFNTIIKTGDNKKVIVPNSGITGGNITNYSANPTRRVDMVFGVGYEDDLKVAKDVLMKVLESDERVLKDPAPVVAVSELADSSVNFVVRPWVNTADYWGVWWDTHEKAKVELEAAGCSIPFPQRDVHIHNENAA